MPVLPNAPPDTATGAGSGAEGVAGMPADGSAPTVPGQVAVAAGHTLHVATGHEPIAALCREIGLEPGARQLVALADYLALLQRWNATYNLTAVRDPQAMLTQHLADCLAVVPPVRRWLASRRGSAAPRLLDVGSGGGLPGVVLAVMVPELTVVCVDTVGKKAAFVRQVAGALALTNLQAAHSRVEALRAPAFDLITSRAFASLADFVRLTAGLRAAGGAWMAMKGRHPADEIAVLPPQVEVFHVEPMAVPGLDAERCLIWIQPKPNPDP
jgi:16S rRNA (guanine527-N7)-methyltransferase